jgi:hypothetical protein
VVWTLTLQPESEGPSLISYAARLLSGGHSGLLSAPSWRTIVRIPDQIDLCPSGSIGVGRILLPQQPFEAIERQISYYW